MADLLRTFLETLETAQREGWSSQLALWVFVLATLAAALWAIRGYQFALRKLEEQYQKRIAELEQRLKDWENNHSAESARLREKLDRVTTLLISTFGSDVPKAFLELMLDTDGARPSQPKEVQGAAGPAARS